MKRKENFLSNTAPRAALSARRCRCFFLPMHGTNYHDLLQMEGWGGGEVTSDDDDDDDD